MLYTELSLTFIFEIMPSLIEINQQIADLQKQAEELLVTERATTVAEINAKIAAFGLKASELSFPAKEVKVRAAKESKAQKERKPKNTVAAKYKGPNGELWSGRGLQPRWLSQAIASGHARESFCLAA